ncbi:MAG: UDP-N-acetylmuramoyl-L-alanyl-D-glutamate--2,6-diaminopimelate ligase [Deltaproteobacteria bacterium]|nr:UDP-N-acetylmuramoyl-L-alanyl-D-glutamate--2,6-diaminopimelate ligase [Deltaproteobacteria bacterium]
MSRTNDAPRNRIETDLWKAVCLSVEQGATVCSHSGQVRPGDVFVALPGTRVQGPDFVQEALRRGAAWVVVDLKTDLPDQPALVRHPDPRQALGDLAALSWSIAGADLTIVAVTGTNGKTTVTHLLEAMFSAVGRTVGVLGTVAYRWPGHVEPAPLTTPDTLGLHRRLADMASMGVDVVCLEASSHALDQNRLAGIPIHAAVFTNLTQDHLDYHRTMDRYFEAKASLFREMDGRQPAAAINLDDPWGRRLFESLPKAVGFGLSEEIPDGSLSGNILAMDAAGLRLACTYGDKSWELSSPLVGQYNASNLLAAQAAGLALGLGPDQVSRVADMIRVPGRLESVRDEHGRHVFVDYAHTPDALEQVCSTLRRVGFSRLVVLFGCGGDRDPAKRPLMAQAVARYADMAVLTSDNPRSEDPLSIMAQARLGLTGCPQIVEEPDRAQAIRLAVEVLAPGEALLVAGKGHEDYQEIAGQRHHFNDIEIVAHALAETTPAGRSRCA